MLYQKINKLNGRALESNKLSTNYFCNILILRLPIVALVLTIFNTVSYGQTFSISDPEPLVGFYCPPNSTEFDSTRARSLGPNFKMKVIGKTCADLGIVARKSASALMSNASKITEAMKNGKFQVSEKGWPLQWQSNGQYRMHNGSTASYKDFTDLDTAQTWNGSGGLDFSAGPCDPGDGYYYIFYQTLEDKQAFDSNGDSQNCPISGYFYMCDNKGMPGTVGYTGTCNPNLDPKGAKCGDGKMDRGEECDLGKLNNNHVKDGFGCRTNCTEVDTWKCSANSNMSDGDKTIEYKKQVTEAHNKFNALCSKQISFVTNNCGGGFTSYNFTFCSTYEQDMMVFKALNASVKMDCSMCTQSPSGLLKQNPYTNNAGASTYQTDCI